MTKFEKSLLKYFLIFIIIFFIGRIIFLVYNYSEIKNENFIEILASFYNGFRMDISAISYIGIFVILLFYLAHQFNLKWIFNIAKVYLFIIIIIYFSIVIGELPIFDEWQTKLTPKAVSYLSNLTEVFRTATISEIIMSFTLIPIFSILAIILLNKKLKFEFKKSNWIRNLATLILILGFDFLGIRGGFYEIPLSASGVFYSTNNTLNFASANSFWSLGYSYYKEHKYDEKEKFVFFKNDKVEEILKGYKNLNDTFPSILNTKNPNIIFVLYESWSADIVDTLNKTLKITPNFNRIKKEGLYFNKCYATGRHSEEGILAALSGFPSLANSYLMGFTQKNRKLPSVMKKLKKRNYNSAFFFGGDLGYANIKSYFYQNPFYKVNDEQEFPTNYIKGRLGYHDDALYSEILKEAGIVKYPFFLGGFTTSTHSPYDVPLKNFKNYGSRESKYINSVVYADSCLGVFFDSLKNFNWYKNTLFVLVSDHSHPTPVVRPYCSPQDHRIVFMLTGGALKKEYRGKVNSTIMSQIDIPNTLLSQMGYKTDEFIFSRNVLGKNYKPFAYFTDKTFLGALDKNGQVLYSLDENKILFNNAGSNSDNIINRAKALLQKSYSEFRRL